MGRPWLASATAYQCLAPGYSGTLQDLLEVGDCGGITVEIEENHRPFKAGLRLIRIRRHQPVELM